MDFALAEWLNLALRWLHVVAGIAWIGSSFYFVWLDNHLRPTAQGEASGELWSVHGGGFYHNQKYQVAPAAMPSELHWFKWEAYFTWISGFSLLALIYYVGARNYLIDPAKADFTMLEATGVGISSLVIGWLFYHFLCRSLLGRNNLALGAVWFAFLVGIAAFLDMIFSSKGAYIHVGALVGSVMVANVFVVIIPNQKRVVADLVSGKTPDPRLGAEAKQRSVHNNYMTLPVLFIMTSQHYPMTYGAERPYLVLALVSLTGVAVRHLFNLRHRNASSPLIYITIAVLAAASVIYVAAEKHAGQASHPGASASTALQPVTYGEIAPILVQHCTSCHSASPSDENFTVAPVGLMLDTYEQARVSAPKIKQRAIDTHTMPMGNPTGMTVEERAMIGRWIAEGTQP